MLRSMTGFGRCFLEDDHLTQMWEVRSVNGRFLDIRWRLPVEVRAFESALEKFVKRHASRGRLEITLSLKMAKNILHETQFDEDRANMMLNTLEDFAEQRGTIFTPDYNRLLGLSILWMGNENEEPDKEILHLLENGLCLALNDWNESREQEAKLLAKDLATRFSRVEEWIGSIASSAPFIKESRFTTVRERLNETLAKLDQELDDARFLQEIILIADKLDVSEELTRLNAHMSRLQELLSSEGDAGKKLDFTLQEAFREVSTCGNKIQDIQMSHLVVDLKTELEKCREQVQNIE